MLRRFFLIGIVLLFGMRVLAHSNLLAIEPDVERTFASAPPEIRMIFTEPVEAEFSRMDVYDNRGELVPLPPVYVPEREPISLVLDSSSLGAGVYTVAWRVVSATDGHPSEGSFPLRIGSNAAAISAVFPEFGNIKTLEIRAFNFLSLAMLMGAVAFPLLIWNQAPIIRHYFFVAWFFVGISGLSLALMQAAIVAGSWDNAFTAFLPLLLETRFGLLWFARMGLWLLLGILAFRKTNPAITEAKSYQKFFPSLQLGLVLAILLSQSLMSHASGAADSWGAIAADWLHLVAMGAWLGGLFVFILIIGNFRKQLHTLSEITARFSNMARLSVFVLILTGSYSAWLHVGNLDALMNTDYGQALLIKLAAFLPVLGLGAVNLFLTSRGLQAGDFRWSKRLRWLLGTEIALCFVILAAVGMMTSVEPARTAYQPPATIPQNSDYFEMALSNGMMVHLTIEPNIAGENRFYVDLLNEDMSAPINDATSIRLSIGETEVEAIFQGGGRYVLSESLNQGEQTISLNIQRPEQSPSLIDFHPIVFPTLEAATPLAPASRQERSFALLLTGLSSLAISVYLLSRSFPQKFIFAGAGFLASLIISSSGILLLIPESLPDDAPIRMVMGAEKPYLITENGSVLRPTANGYETLPFDAPANDVYIQSNGTLWIASDAGLYRDEEGLWTQESAMPVHELISTHGFILALGDGEIYRIEEGSVLTDRRTLEIPLDAPASNFVMLGNHSHVLHNGDSVYSSSSVGLGWTPLNAPVPIEAIGNDENGDLLALSAGIFWTWDWSGGEWTEREGLPQGVSDWELFDGELYFLAEGRVYEGNQALALQGQFVDIAFQYPDSLWLLESNGTLWRRRLTSETWEQP